MVRQGLHIILLFFLITVELPVFAQSETDDQLAAQYFQNKEYVKAIDLYERLYDKNPSDFYFNYYFRCLLELKDFKKAEKIVRKQIKRNPLFLEYQVDLGLVYSFSGDESKAQKQYESTITQLQPDKDQILNLATAFLNNGLTDNAIETYKKGNKLVKNRFEFSFQLADIYSANKNFQLMINEYLELLDEGAEYVADVQSKLQQVVVSEKEDGQVGKMIKETLMKRIQQNPNKSIYSEMLMWLSLQQKDFESALTQAKSLDKRFKESGSRIYELANTCISNAYYDVAVKAFEYLISKGKENYFYMKSRVGLLNVKFLKITHSYNFHINELVLLENEYISLLNDYGKNDETIYLIKDLAHLEAFYLNKSDTAIKLLNESLSINVAPKMKAECKIELADISLMSGDVWEASLLYSQVEKDFKDDPIGHTAKFKNAKLSYYIGEFKWAKAQLDVLKAATSKLIANDAMELSLLIGDVYNSDTIADALRIYAHADLLAFQNKYDLALQTLDSVLILYPGHALTDEVYYKQAEIKIFQGKFEKADSLLQLIVTVFPQDILADDALFKSAELNEIHFKNKDKAMKLYEKILIDYPGSLFAVEARKRFRKLRGDTLN